MPSPRPLPAALNPKDPSLAPLARAALAQLASLEAAIGGRDALIGALSLAPLDRDGKYFLSLLSDPDREKTPLLEVIHQARLRPGRILGWVEAGLTAGSTLAAKVHIARGTPVVVAEVMKQGARYQDDCGACQATGTITPEPSPADPNPSPAPCPHCRGVGQLSYPADPDARKYALELSGLLPKGGGISITNTNLNAVSASAGGAGEVDRFQEAMDRVLYGTGGAPALDVEFTEAAVVSPPPEGA